MHARHLHNFLILGDSSNYYLHFTEEDAVACRNSKSSAASWSVRSEACDFKAALLKRPNTLLSVLKLTKENKTRSPVLSREKGCSEGKCSLWTSWPSCLWYGGCSSSSRLFILHFPLPPRRKLPGQPKGRTVYLFPGGRESSLEGESYFRFPSPSHTPCLAQGPLVTVWQAHEVSRVVLTCQSHLSTRC